MLGLAPYPGDLGRVISLLCAVASSMAKGGKATSYRQGCSQDARSGRGGCLAALGGFGWWGGTELLPAGVSTASGAAVCCGVASKVTQTNAEMVSGR